MNAHIQNLPATGDPVSELLSKTIHDIETHRLMHQTGTLGQEWTNIYNNLSIGNVEPLLVELRKHTDSAMRVRLVVDFLRELASLGTNVQHMAVDLNNTTALIWAEIDSEKDEEDLYRAELKVNATYYVKGYKLDVMVVESEDKIPVPTHYKEITSIFHK